MFADDGANGASASVPEADSSTAGASTPSTPPVEDAWKIDSKGREYIAARGRPGVVYRRDNESIIEALARDAKGPKGVKPKKPLTAKKPPAPTRPSLQEIEHGLTELLRTPAMIGAATQDPWVVEHFVAQAPVLARNLVVAAEHNPWIREKLETAMSDEMVMMKLITMLGVGGAFLAYALPPLVFYFDPPFVPDKVRDGFAIPKREKTKREEPERADPAPPAPAAAAEPAAGAPAS